MTAYAKQGNRLAVRRHYQKLESMLQKELGLTPSRTMRDLCRELVG